ncbi:hypothetical protein EYR40_009881 [Pleurotus pulmonarius]|nr:hypothetical protein EYR40_009881 [Pleurotus pulmonarius]
MTDKQLRADDILAVLYSRGDGETFHWAICIPISTRSAIKLHAKDPGLGHWFFEDPPPEDDLVGSNIVCAAVKIGHLAGDFDIGAVNALLGAIPMEVPASDATIEPRFSCRVWFKEAVRQLARAGAITCPDVYVLEDECREYARGNDASQGFDRHIRPSDWITFQKYSWRVHEICVDFEGTDYAASAFIDIASSRPVADLLPNLRRLTYHDGGSSFQFLPLLIPATLTHIALTLAASSEADLTICKDVISYLPEKAPNLQSLDISIPTDFDAVSDPDLGVEILLPALPHLKNVVLPSCFLPSCLRPLAHLPALETVILDSIHRQTLDIEGLRFHDAFPSLTRLAITWYSFKEVAALLHTCTPNSLRKLSVSSSKMEHISAFSHLFDVACSVCPDLQTISLDGKWRKNSATPQQAAPDDFFRILHRRPNLTSLILSDTPPLFLDIKTLSDLLIGLPLLRVLCLGEFPAHSPTLPLSSLSKLAPLCPHMEHLELYMDTRSVPDTTSTGPNDTECFKRLKSLNVGASPLGSPAIEVTSFLSSILPEGCRLSRSYDDAIPIEHRISKYDTWKPVVDFLPMMIRMRKAEKFVDSHSPSESPTKVNLSPS